MRQSYGPVSLQLVVTRNPYKANWQAMQAWGTCIVDLFIYWRSWSCHRLLQLCKYPVGRPFDSSSGQTWSNFSKSPLTRQTCAGTHLVGTSSGGALDWPCE